MTVLTQYIMDIFILHMDEWLSKDSINNQLKWKQKILMYELKQLVINEIIDFNTSTLLYRIRLIRCPQCGVAKIENQIDYEYMQTYTRIGCKNCEYVYAFQDAHLLPL